MPPKVLPDIEGFRWLENELTKRGFVPISRINVQRSFARFSRDSSVTPSGKEAGFTFSANGLTVVVWTTWIHEAEKARDIDSGWVLILGDDRPLYFSRPIHRTKNFLDRILKISLIAWWRVLTRPSCPECHKPMDIVSGRALKARYWSCDRVKSHGDKKPRHLGWDVNLPPKMLAFVEKLRKERAKRRVREKKEGKSPTPAMLIRKPWRRE